MRLALPGMSSAALLQAHVRVGVERLHGRAHVHALVDGLLHVGAQRHEIRLGVGAGGGEIRHVAVAGHDDSRIEFFDDRKRREPVSGVADRNHAEQPVHVDHVAGEQHVLLRQPDHRVAGRVRAVAMLELERDAAQVQARTAFGDVASGQRRHGAVGAVVQRGLQPGQVVAAARLHVGPRIRVRDDLGALFLEVAVAEPAMVLPAGVDDPLHRLRRDLS